MTDVVAVVIMDEAEARQCLADIGASLGNARAKLLDLDEREGWRALGYDSLRACMVAEFGQSQSALYRQLLSAKVERSISRTRENEKPLPYRQAETLQKLPEEQQAAAWAEAVETAPGGKVTAKHVATVVTRRLAPPEVSADKEVKPETEGPEEGASRDDEDVHYANAVYVELMVSLRRTKGRMAGVGGSKLASPTRYAASLLQRERRSIKQNQREFSELVEWLTAVWAAVK